MSFLLRVLLVAALVTSARAQSAGGEGDATRIAKLTHVDGWPALVTRDKRLSFGMLTRTSAVAALSRTDVSDERKAIALMALGCAKVVGERSRIESWAQEGKSDLRQAAILALGELGGGEVSTLTDLAGKRSEMVSETALLALVRCGSASGLELVRGIAADTAQPMSSKAAAILQFAADPLSTPDLEVARVLYELRFAAARSHGLIDGQAWDVIVLDDLCADQKFLNRVIYRAASELKKPGIRDHFFEIALEKGAPERLRGVVNAIPVELAQMVDTNAFVPADEREWNALLSEIDQRHLEGFTEPILKRALAVPALRRWATVLLARGGSKGSVELLEIGLESGDPVERAMCAWELGASGRDEYLTSLSALEQDPVPDVRAAALIAEVRLGSEKALQRLRDRLGLDRSDSDKDKNEKVRPDAQWVALIDATSRAVKTASVHEVLVEALPHLPTNARAVVSAALIETGQNELRPWLRDYLRSSNPGGGFAARCVAALASGPGMEDVQLFRELFPVEDDLELDVELAYALIRLKDPEIVPVLRASLWSEPLNRSVLTGALWIETAGLDSLRIEVLHPPIGASPRDSRRVGLALGEWGGVDQVDWLAERLNVGDPALQGAVFGALGARTH